MRSRRIEQSALTAFFIAACVMSLAAAFTAFAHAQSGLPVPQVLENVLTPRDR
jgi:hypothetical protein